MPFQWKKAKIIPIHKKEKNILSRKLLWNSLKNVY
jgi:hypothetical protein